MDVGAERVDGFRAWLARTRMRRMLMKGLHVLSPERGGLLLGNMEVKGQEDSHGQWGDGDSRGSSSSLKSARYPLQPVRKAPAYPVGAPESDGGLRADFRCQLEKDVFAFCTARAEERVCI